MPTENNNLPVRRYERQFRDLLAAVFSVQSYFGDFFAGGLEALDGVSEKDTAFSVKTSDIPVVVGNYNMGANVAFGTGTGNSNRFGERTEIIYTNTDVPYSWNWAYHEGIDIHTVNNSLDAATADRLELQAQAKTRLFNQKHAAFIASVAGNTEALTSYDAADVLALFNALDAYYVNIEAIGTRIATVNPALYNAIVDHPLTVTGKNSSVNVDTNNIVRFKDFLIRPIPDAMLTVDTDVYAAYTYIENVGKAFTGINTVRTIPSEDFDGVALQGAGKAGEFIIDDNKKAVVKVSAPPATP